MSSAWRTSFAVRTSSICQPLCCLVLPRTRFFMACTSNPCSWQKAESDQTSKGTLFSLYRMYLGSSLTISPPFYTYYTTLNRPGEYGGGEWGHRAQKYAR